MLENHPPAQSLPIPSGLPPICPQAGEDGSRLTMAECSQTARRRAGAEVRLEVFPEMLHSFQMMAGRAPKPMTR